MGPALQFIDLAEQQRRIKPEIDAAIARVLAHGKYIMGPEVVELEAKLCAFVDSKQCISVSNGTDALIVALMAYGVGPGDAVITTPFTFFATIEAILTLNATPIFADIDASTFNICPHEIKKAIIAARERTDLTVRGIMPVDLFGLPCNYQEIMQVAQENNLFVIQDAAQAFGATTDGKRCPIHGDIGTTSFFPAKPLGCYGDGGAVFTDDEELAETIRSIRVHGKGEDKYDNVRLGKNARLDTIQAAILLQKLAIYDDELAARSRVAQQYAERFRDINDKLPATRQITTPSIDPSDASAWAQYTIRVPDRDGVRAKLSAIGIPSLVYYRTPSHLLRACEHLGERRGAFPCSEAAAKEVISLPFHPYLEYRDIELITDAVLQCVA